MGTEVGGLIFQGIRRGDGDGGREFEGTFRAFDRTRLGHQGQGSAAMAADDRARVRSKDRMMDKRKGLIRAGRRDLSIGFRGPATVMISCVEGADSENLRSGSRFPSFRRDSQRPRRALRLDRHEGHLVAEGRVVLERDFWIAVMKAQRDLGVPIPAEAIKDYERVKDNIDLASIAKRERMTLHDVKARIEEFSELAEAAVHPPRAHQPRPHGKRRAAPDFPRARKSSVSRRAPRCSRCARRRRIATSMITGRTHNVRRSRPRSASASRCSARNCSVALHALEELHRALSGARPQGRGRHAARPAHAARRRRRESRPAREPRAQAPRLPRSLGAVGQVYPRSPRFRGRERAAPGRRRRGELSRRRCG